MSAPLRARTVGVIGTGRVGAVLGAALAAAGLDVVAATGGSPASAARAMASWRTLAFATTPPPSSSRGTS